MNDIERNLVINKDPTIISILADLLERTKNSIEYVDWEQFNVDHQDKREVIDTLIIDNYYIRREPEKRDYRLTCVGLYFIDNPTSSELIKDIDSVIGNLHIFYKNHLSKKKLPIATISKALNLSCEKITECIDYLQPTYTVERCFSDIKNKTNSLITVTPNILNIDDIRNFVEQYMTNRAASFLADSENNHESKSENLITKDTHGNTIRNALKREAVLIAALYVINKYPKECANQNGKLVIRNIAKLIDLNCKDLFKEYNHNPPFCPSRMEQLIGESFSISS